MSKFAILTDTTRCTGCEACVAACKSENQLGPDRRLRQTAAIDDLSSSRYTTLLHRAGGRHIRRQCRHCLHPACVSACLVGAMKQSRDGPVVYDEKRCMGCRYCMVACPYGIPRYDWDKAVPYVRKCTMCYEERLRCGKMPACVEACPEEATIFGSRDEMLAVARERIDADPQRYFQKIDGREEVGGTSVLYISDIPLGFLACKPDVDKTPLPNLTHAALAKAPPVIVGMAGLMTGIYWIIGRRMRMQELETAAYRQTSAPPAEKPPEEREVSE